MRLLAIDFGQKFWGLAWADELGIALPVGSLNQQPVARRWEALREVIQQRRPEALVVGYPLHMDGREGKRTAEVDKFISQLETQFQLPVRKVDERLSTRQASAGLSLREAKKEKNQGRIDARAAAIFLSDFVSSQREAAGADTEFLQS
jgi:putative Holliday junction resolvase